MRPLSQITLCPFWGTLSSTKIISSTISPTSKPSRSWPPAPAHAKNRTLRNWTRKVSAQPSTAPEIPAHRSTTKMNATGHATAQSSSNSLGARKTRSSASTGLGRESREPFVLVSNQFFLLMKKRNLFNVFWSAEMTLKLTFDSRLKSVKVDTSWNFNHFVKYTFW